MNLFHFPLLKPILNREPKRKIIIGSVPLFKNSESETDDSPMHAKYIHNVLNRKVSHDLNFGVYQDDTNGSFKIGWSNFKNNNKHVFVDGKRNKAKQVLWELLTQSRPDKNVVNHLDTLAYKQILLLSNAHRLNCKTLGQDQSNKVLKYTRFISQLFTNTKERSWKLLT